MKTHTCDHASPLTVGALIKLLQCMPLGAVVRCGISVDELGAEGGAWASVTSVTSCDDAVTLSTAHAVDGCVSCHYAGRTWALATGLDPFSGEPVCGTCLADLTEEYET